MDDSIWQTVRENQRLKAEIERLKKQLFFEIESAYDRGKTAGAKEFAERLKNATMPITLGGKYKYDVITKEGIDNLAEEMGCSDAK